MYPDVFGLFQNVDPSKIEPCTHRFDELVGSTELTSWNQNHDTTWSATDGLSGPSKPDHRKI